MAPGFSVDTHLLRELGELLVGRDSTAILELVKNAYDANATHVVVELKDRNSPEAYLQISDNGDGMSKIRFETAFLRIASRSKEGGSGRSPRLLRRFTGQKGIGRLASHKLANRLEVTSVPISQVSASRIGVKASIDWDIVEQQDDLNDLPEGLSVRDFPTGPLTAPGTTLLLSRLKSDWSDKELARFVIELRSSQPAEALLDPKSAGIRLARPLLIEKLAVRDSAPGDPGFTVDYVGDLEVGDPLWTDASREFQWCIEIDAIEDDVVFSVAPLKWYAEKEPLAKSYTFSKKISVENRPRFQARIYMLPNASASRGPLSGFVRSTSGIRVFMEGFRVLPYGEYGDDWLGLDRDYRSGPRFYSIDVDESSSAIDLDRREGLSAVTNAGYFGAVFLREDFSGGLRTLVNREGFVPDDVYRALVETVQTGVRLSVRVRRSVANQIAAREAAEKAAADKARADEAAKLAADSAVGQGDGHPGDSGIPIDDDPDDSEGSSGGDSSESLSHSAGPFKPPGAARLNFELLSRSSQSVEELAAIDNARKVTESIFDGSSGIPSTNEIRLAKGFRAALDGFERLQSRQTDLRILAGVGLQLGAFVHDINGMQEVIRNVRALVEPLTGDPTLSRAQSAQVRQVIRAVEEVSQTLGRQSSYLSDVLTVDRRRRRSRIDIESRLPTVLQLISPALAADSIDLDVQIEEGTKTPLMFPAEVSIILTNLLTNAAKNAGVNGRILVRVSRLGEQGARLTVQNTGSAVDLEDAERWFLPFESTTVEVDENLGQGLGLGLPIVRAIADDYRGSVFFDDPDENYSTSIMVLLPDPQEIK